jgi:FAD:protein FMN transferase
LRTPESQPWLPRQCSAQRAQLWLGTLVEVAAHAPSPYALDAGITAAFDAIARIHHALSGHDPSSELSRINRLAAIALQPVSSDLRTVLNCALDLAVCSRGSFDPSVGGRVTDLGFLPRHAATHGNANWRDVELGPDGVRFRRPLVLDFGGIAKGYAVDCAIAALHEHGVTAGRVNAGGDLRVFGPGHEPVHVRTGGPQGIIVALAAIGDSALATSAYGGDRRRSTAGRWATPLIDPRAGLPVMSTRTVSVIAPTCMVADALTKVVMLRGRAAARVLREYDACATVLSPAAGRWRCTQLPAAAI